MLAVGAVIGGVVLECWSVVVVVWVARPVSRRMMYGGGSKQAVKSCEGSRKAAAGPIPYRLSRAFGCLT